MIFAQTIAVTTKCSAGCNHCPFSDPQISKLNLELNDLCSLITKSKSPLLVLSGGEFFEYDQLESLFLYLEKSTKYYRIATGGHLDLKASICQLLSLPGLQGVSLGTDVILRQTSKVKIENWYRNLALFSKNKIPYSLTFTLLGNDLPNLEKQVMKLSKKAIKPQFIYLRKNSTINPLQVNQIKNIFANFSIIEEFIS